MKRHFTVFWISPLRGQVKRLHLRWQTLLLGVFVLFLGIGLGIGGVLWYQARMKHELFATRAKIEEMRKSLLILEAEKKEQEAQLKRLTKEAENVLTELNNLRELEQKVREIMEKNLQSQLKRLGVTLTLSTTEVQTCIPLHRFLGNLFALPSEGEGGPELATFLPLSPQIVPIFSSPHDLTTKVLEDTLIWLRGEILLRRKAFEEIIDLAAKRERILEVVPSRWPTWGRVSSNYGWRRDPFTGRRAWHTGVDIAAPVGRSVVAAAEGRVVFTGWNGNYGKCIIVRHDFGFETIYGHLSRILVSVGDWVKKAQKIGEVGNTGRSTGPHLHYEVRRYGKVVNPWPHLP